MGEFCVSADMFVYSIKLQIDYLGNLNEFLSLQNSVHWWRSVFQRERLCYSGTVYLRYCKEDERQWTLFSDMGNMLGL